MKKLIIAAIFCLAISAQAGTIIVVNDSVKIDLGDEMDKRIDSYLDKEWADSLRRARLDPEKTERPSRDQQIIDLLAKWLNDAVVENDKRLARIPKQQEADDAAAAVPALVHPKDVKATK